MSFRLKTILGIALIESVLLLTLIVSVLNFLSESNEEQLRQRAETTSRLFANATKDAVLATDLATLESFVDEILTNPDIVYVRISSNDLVLAEGGSPHLLKQSRTTDTDVSDVHDSIFDVRAEITEAGVQFGVIEMGLSTSAIERLLAKAKRWTFSIAGLEIVLVAIFSFVLGTYLTRQLSRLKTASKVIAQQGPGHTITVRGNDEIAAVAEAFNSMSSSLQQSYSELEKSRDSYRDMAAIANSSQAKNDAILSASLDAMITIDAAGKVVDYNDVAVKTFGWKRGEITGQPIADFIIPEALRNAHREGMQHYLASGEGPVLNQLLELDALHKSGHTFPVEIAISPIETDHGPMFTAFIRDITGRRAAESELQLAAHAFETSEAMFIADEKGCISRINRAFTQITGYEYHDVVGENPRLLKSDRHDRAFYSSLWQQLNDHGEWSGEIYNRRKSGEVFPEHLNISAVHNNEGKLTHYVAHFVDISEQKKNEERLHQARHDAEAASRAKSNFLATMSHEIRTPMNAVLGVLGLLKETSLNAQQQQWVRTGRDSGELLLSIINDILDYSRMEADKVTLETSNFDLHKLVTQTVDLLKSQADKKQLALITQLDPELPRYACGDPDRLRQIIINLVNNAIKFTHEGSVNVRASSSGHSANSFVFHCAVEDTGVGIADEHHSDLFDEFTMADQTHSRKYEGTGLGLAICKRLVALMNGKINFHSKLGSGTTFFFDAELRSTGPDDEIQGGESGGDAGTQLVPLPNTRILLAEDNTANQMILKNILEFAGLQVDIVSNGREAVQAVADLPYDIVLMDISMPEMDGMEATQAIRELKTENANTPIIALTAHALAGDRERFLAVGMNDYLTKPINRDAALHVIAQWTGAASHDQPIPDTDIQASAPNVDSNNGYVDEAVLLQLVKDTSAEVVPELIKLYVEDSRQRVKNIQQALSEDNMHSLEFECHTLGSSAGSHGNPKLFKLSRHIEQLCQEGELQKAKESAAEIVTVADESLQQLADRAKQGF